MSTTGVNIVTVKAEGAPADDVHAAGEFPDAARRTASVRRRVEWWTCRSSSTCPARSAGDGPRSEMRTRTFMNSFDANARSRLADVLPQRRQVIDQMPSPSRVQQDARSCRDVPNSLPGGSTTMVEGLYRGWDEICDGSQRSAVRPSRHRPVHGRLLEQRARALPRVNDGARERCEPTTSRTTVPIRTVRPTCARDCGTL